MEINTQESNLKVVLCQLYYFSTRWRSWLRHCTTNRKVAGSIPNSVIGAFL
jgi:50S ribosomal subunit-associated GTPase HflX